MEAKIIPTVGVYKKKLQEPGELALNASGLWLPRETEGSCNL